MKNTTFIAVMLTACCISAGAAVTPIDRGSAMLSGKMYYENQSASGSSIGIFMLETDLGGFLSPGFMMGVSIAITSVSLEGESETVFGFGPVVGYYADTEPGRDEIKGAVYPYFKAFFRYLGESGSDMSQTGFGGAVGIDVMISDAVAVDLGVLFSFDKLHSDYGSSPTITTIRIGAGIVSFIY